MTKLNQVVALEKGLKGRVKSSITAMHHQLQKSALFTGLSRVYQPKDEDGDTLPAENTRVQLTVPDQLDAAAQQLTNLFDVVATKEWGNTHAKADIVVDGSVLIKGAPVPYLLFLEKELVDWRTFVTKVPVLDQAEVWVEDDTVDNQWRTMPTGTVRSKKVLRYLTLAPATDKHPAQVQTFNEDVPVGTWMTTKMSGAIPTKRRDQLIERADKLLDAVKAAREEANGTEVTQVKPGEDVFAYLLA